MATRRLRGLFLVWCLLREFRRRVTLFRREVEGLRVKLVGSRVVCRRGISVSSTIIVFPVCELRNSTRLLLCPLNDLRRLTENRNNRCRRAKVSGIVKEEVTPELNFMGDELTLCRTGLLSCFVSDLAGVALPITRVHTGTWVCFVRACSRFCRDYKWLNLSARCRLLLCMRGLFVPPFDLRMSAIDRHDGRACDRSSRPSCVPRVPNHGRRERQCASSELALSSED